MDAAVGAQEEQDAEHAVRIAEDGRQHGGVAKLSGRRQTSARSRSSTVSRRRISRALAVAARARPPAG